MSSSMSIPSSSSRLITSKFPSFFPPSKTLISLPSSLSHFKPISFERLPTKPNSLSSSSPSPSSSSSLQPIEELPPKLQEIIKLFQAVPDPRAKYKQLLFYGENLSSLDPRFKTKENKVEGCVSQVWVRAYLDPDGNIWYDADSDSVLTKGLAALLVQGLSGRPVNEILRISPVFITVLGLQQSLTPSRNNGFLNMLKLMQKKALILALEAEKAKEEQRSAVGLGSVVGSDNGYSSVESPIESSETGRGDLDSATSEAGEHGIPGGVLGSRGERIRERLEKELNPVELEVEDVSYQHAGHAGARGSDGETHFNLKIVSKEFVGKSLVKRHRMVYDLLQDELQSGLHALSIVAKTPAEV